MKDARRNSWLLLIGGVALATAGMVALAQEPPEQIGRASCRERV